MKVILESTTKKVTVNGVEARVWEGKTASGIPVHAYITRIACPDDADQEEFKRDLETHSPPSPELAAAIPPRLLL